MNITLLLIDYNEHKYTRWMVMNGYRAKLSTMIGFRIAVWKFTFEIP